jgi:putative tryptophan/tyrosine transport system substrate-binding protein
VRRVGVLMGITESVEAQSRLTAFTWKLQALGWADGRNLRIDYHWGAANPTLIGNYAAELIALTPDVILVNGGNVLTEVRQQTQTVPIVFVNAADPVEMGFVASLAHPGANITGFTNVETSVIENGSSCSGTWRPMSGMCRSSWIGEARLRAECCAR